MFNPATLPPPPFSHGPQPLRLTPEIARPSPQGECHFQHPGNGSFRCPCQTYQHDRKVAGNVCDCGHLACYHAPTMSRTFIPPDKIVAALIEKVKNLEDAVVKEREARARLISTERQAWEQEARMLREALAPFYRSEHDMRSTIVDLDRRLDLSTAETARVRQKLSALDDSTRTFGRRLDDCEGTRCRKRKASIEKDTAIAVMSPGSTYTLSSAASDTTSTSMHRTSQPPSPPPVRAMSPRSSGILHLKSEHGQTYHVPLQRLSVHDDEPRSSGFLSIDLAERLRHKTTTMKTAANDHSGQRSPVPSSLSTGLPSTAANKPSGVIAVSDLLSTDNVPSYMEGRLRKKMKHTDPAMSGLELLANVASPLMQQG